MVYYPVRSAIKIDQTSGRNDQVYIYKFIPEHACKTKMIRTANFQTLSQWYSIQALANM
jgi:hypothetical protein